jgi:hypothetical protein
MVLAAELAAVYVSVGFRPVWASHTAAGTLNVR